MAKVDQVSEMRRKLIEDEGMSPEDAETKIQLARQRLRTISPNDGKYADMSEPLIPFFSPEAEWVMCVRIQRELLATRVGYGQAEQRHLNEIDQAIRVVDPLNISLLESNVTRHDQKAVLEELGRYVSPETKALLHPGTTSYDILDTARSILARDAWQQVMRPQAIKVISSLTDIAEETSHALRAGRTHLRVTSPIPIGYYLSTFAVRLTDVVVHADQAFSELRGKISGIVGTGDSIDVVIGEGRGNDFELDVLAKFDLLPDYASTQIVSKGYIMRAANEVLMIMGILADFAEDMRILYSDGIQEVQSRGSSERLGGSSADPGKDNPINWENIAGKYAVVKAGYMVVVDLLVSNLERDLRGSVQARYEPQGMMAETFESLQRFHKELGKLAFSTDFIAANLQRVRDNPTEAMTSIARAHGWVHPELGVGYDAVNRYIVDAKRRGVPLLQSAQGDPEFVAFFQSIPERHQRILQGELEIYAQPGIQRAKRNITYVRMVIGG
ncbi:hypothetical protein J4460_08540 [Candidatus Woesearchaeota archaeon]|nr:MAG: adenylosuccinate lyase [archaeon GW2011_AR4]MBS3130686.1 hypothetical protein [Candidatus Woesearchaeota archaeon]HIH37480.1 hypothetical protein [Candidatus Woesearchaeota archaeon]HIH48920.1 hypothetical protein [Candidatus Woesearchaeota archaeon]HIJ04357.1 hypothetical protein [Candidatus Woesearchaeota archaeon]